MILSNLYLAARKYHESYRMNSARVFKACVKAIRKGLLIEREGASDKEFHFQNWFRARLVELSINFDSPGRNTYPDFRLVQSAEGYEVKGLAYPGREADYDCNSQMPCGEHNGRQVYYVFGRYPAKPDGNRYPVLDLVLCHGSFLNADNTYQHENKSFRGFGSYGDILVRDRKMYVAPTPFALVEGAAHRRTLILPLTDKPGKEFIPVGTIRRKEVNEILIKYQFDLRTNELKTTTAPNSNAGREHTFVAYRLEGDPTDKIILRSRETVLRELRSADAELDDPE
jgi:hypothetical protein